MQKYYYNDGVNRFGPFTLEELQAKNISASTPVWYDGLANWTPAGELDELKSIFSGAAAAVTAQPQAEQVTQLQAVEAVQPVVEEIKAAEPAPVEKAAEITVSNVVVTESKEEPAPPPPAAVQTTTAAVNTTETVAAAATSTAPAPAPAAAKPARKKGSPVLTWVLPILLLGGTGYYVYQDMEKNKDNKVAEITLTDNQSSDDSNQAKTTEEQTSVSENKNETTEPVVTTEKATMDTSKGNTSPATELKENTTDKNKPVTPPTLNPPAKDQAELKKQQEKQKQLVAEAKKKEEEKKKQAALKEEERKKQQALKEKELRNNWSRYVTIGSFTVEGDDKVKPFAIPVNNSYNAILDRVTVRVDYLKKEKVVGSETLTLTNIPGKSNQTVQATGNKKGKTANVYITGINSRQLHLCYPQNSGVAGDPYFCN